MADVRFNHITFRYGKKCIFEDLSLTVEESQIMCLVGPSGCGKTTLVRCLLGFIKPETGSIYVGDRCLFDAEKGIDVSPEHRHIGVVFQDYAVWPHMTVLENVLYPMKKMARAHHALEQVRMLGYEEHLPSQLSGGQQQRVAIARALVSSDEVIVMDEPITNLDAKLREEMLTEIRLIQHDIRTTILYITHDQEAALQLCDRMAIMDREGKLCQIGEDEDIILRPANRFVFEFIGVSNFFPFWWPERNSSMMNALRKSLPAASPWKWGAVSTIWSLTTSLLSGERSPGACSWEANTCISSSWGTGRSGCRSMPWM